MNWVTTRRRLIELGLPIVSAILLTLALTLSISASALAGPNAWTKTAHPTLVVSAVAVDPTNPNTIYTGTRGSGIYRSYDAGQTWAPVNSGLLNLYINDIEVDPTNPTILLAGAGQSEALGDANSGVYRSANRGDSWTKVASGYVGAIAITPQNHNILYAGGGPAVQKSADNGLTWASSGSGIVNTTINGIAVDPTNPNNLIAAGATEGGSGNLYRSTNAGASWAAVVTAISGQSAFFSVAFTQSSAGVVGLAGALSNLLRSTDGGATWSQIASGQSFLSLRVNPLDGKEVFAGTAGGAVWRSTDFGATWSQLGSLGQPNVRALAISNTSPQTLYAGADSGLYAYTFSLTPTPTPPPTGTNSWYFAEGSTQPPFDTWFLLQNPNSDAAQVSLTFQRPDGSQLILPVTVGPQSRYSVFANQVIPNSAFSTRIDSNRPIYAERSMFFRQDGTVVTGIPGPARTWYLAEGSTQNPFQTWILLQNPNSVQAQVTLNFQRPDGSMVSINRSLGPNSRDSVFVNQHLPNAAFATKIDSDNPIIVERAMYLAPGGNPIGGGHAVAGVTAPSQDWYFADAQTSPLLGRNFDSWLLLQNSNATAVSVTIQLMTTDGAVQTIVQNLPPTSRQSIFLNQVQSGSFGIVVNASQPIIAEKARYYGNEPYRGADATVGSPTLATTWDLPEGSTQPPFTELISILNPHNSNMSVTLTFQTQTGQVINSQYTINPHTKLTVDVATVAPNSAASTRVTTSLPSVVERTMLFTKNGRPGGTNTIGIAH